LKIKCPICDEICVDFASLKSHLYSSRKIEGDYIILVENHISLIKKIHEKIEQIHPNESFESWKKNTLKSLLD